MTPDLEAKYGAYPDMFVRLLGNRGLHLEFAFFQFLMIFFRTLWASVMPG